MGRYLYGVDLRRVGSGNPGATNLMRSVGKKPGAAALMLDAFKGGLPAWGVPRWLTPEGVWLNAVHAGGQGGLTGPALTMADVGVLVGLAAILGHVFSPFLGFRGGKGVATSLGVFLALAPGPMLLTMAVCIPVIAVTRIISVGSLLGAVVFPGLVWASGVGGWLLRGVSAGLGVLIIWRHRSNIRRLWMGTEKRL